MVTPPSTDAAFGVKIRWDGSAHLSTCPFFEGKGPTCTCCWVFIEGPDRFFGPYPGPEAGFIAMNNSLFIEGELHDPGGTDCIMTIGSPVLTDDAYFEVYVIDLTDPHHTGVEYPFENAEGS